VTRHLAEDNEESQSGGGVAPDGSLLADSHVEDRPTVNDMASLLASAMRRPLAGKTRRPRTWTRRGHPQWRELFGDLAEIGIEATVEQEVAGIEVA
jgi:hypothetical protein